MPQPPLRQYFLFVVAFRHDIFSLSSSLAIFLGRLGVSNYLDSLHILILLFDEPFFARLGYFCFGFADFEVLARFRLVRRLLLLLLLWLTFLAYLRGGSFLMISITGLVRSSLWRFLFFGLV